jgi:hypothetical protein
VSAIPVALFAYRRPDLLARTLASLRGNGVTLIYAFSDGPRSEAEAPLVDEVRGVIRAVDWAEVHLTARATNVGLGPSVTSGISEVLRRHDAAMISEDDLEMAPGTVAWVTAALERYRDDARVFSVSAWTHPRVTPPTRDAEPHFSRRFSGLFWGTWARAWNGMEEGSAADRLRSFAERGGDPAEYGTDIPAQAAAEKQKNLWAVRFVAEHLLHGKLSVCPPWTLTEHIGYDPRASNAAQDPFWHVRPDRAAPPVPREWPEPVEHPDVARLWRAAVAEENRLNQPPSLATRAIRKLLRLVGVRPVSR